MSRTLALCTVLLLALTLAAVNNLDAPLGAAAVTVEIKEWEVPTPGSRPHDPAVAPDGSLWYTGQYANTLGRLDPATGDIREYQLKTPKSGPHGLVADDAGNIWYTGNTAAHIGKLDPRTGEVTEYPMPDPRAEDPHTPIFDQQGILWFTVQRGNFVGKLHPKTGKVTLQEAPTTGARPYGIEVNSKGIPFFALLNAGKLASIDPDSMKIRVYDLPEGARVRRLTITPDDLVYYADFARGYLGRLDPATGTVEEWRSPGGEQSRPYGIAATADGIVWYSESGVEPNTLVRFDPRDKSFSTWEVPSGGGVIRHMVATPQGDLYLACSGVNKVGIARVN